MTRNSRTLFGLWALAILMLYGAFQFDYLYKKFCQITGYGGTTGRAELNETEVLDRMVRVNFDSNVANGLPWMFKPEQPYMDIKLGQTGMAFYMARNDSDVPIVGTATFNVTPIKAAPFFIKIDCFCFEEQLLMPGEEVSMPVQFFVDPQMDDEKRYDDVTNVTLSYKFFEKENPETVDLTEAAAQSRDEVN